MGSDADERDKRIRELHERRHALQRRDRLGLPMTAGQEKELSDVLGEIDELELAEAVEAFLEDGEVNK